MAALKANLTTVMVAHTLARAHNHLWGRISKGEIMSCSHLGSVDLEKLHQLAVEKETAEYVFGIAHPEVDELGRIVHTTGSGRLRWVVSPERVEIEVTRGSDGMTVVSGYVNNPGVDGWKLDIRPEAKARHVEAAAEVVALVGCLLYTSVYATAIGSLPMERQTELHQDKLDQDSRFLRERIQVYHPDVVKEVVEKGLGVELLDVNLEERL